MAGGWAPEGAVQDQIDDTIKDAVEAARLRLGSGEAATHCEECGDPIPQKRRQALPGARTCVGCQLARDKTRSFSVINRLGSKDSQLR